MNIRSEKMGLDPEQLRELLARQYQQQQENTPQSDTAQTADKGTETQVSSLFENFNVIPEELIAYLDRYVIKQHEAKAILSTKICTHFNRLNLPADEGDGMIGNIKNNILMIGPTGVGKTFIVKLIANHLGVPFVKADATKFSETGYVGGDVEDLVRDLVREADGDIDRAQCGIIYIDEIDKIASSSGQHGPDVSRSGVQRNLLKLMEETEVDLKAPHDLASQMESVMQMQRTGSVEQRKVNTRNILFVVSGAFSGLDQIIDRRLNRGAIGFHPEETPELELKEGSSSLQQVRSEDLVAYGFESEFVGRLPVVAVLNDLGRDDLLEILRSPRSSVVLSKKRDFRAYGIEVDFTEEAFELLADRAYEERTGARSLVGAIERALLNFEKRLPSTKVERFTVDSATILNQEETLEELVFDGSLQAYIRQFNEEHDIELNFSDTARQWLKKRSLTAQRLPDELCTELLADYGQGLKLIEVKQIDITPELLESPKDQLNLIIKKAYDRGS
jgi:ATP-dependent Clp protease ATP-binding subunit ClpX